MSPKWKKRLRRWNTFAERIPESWIVRAAVLLSLCILLPVSVWFWQSGLAGLAAGITLIPFIGYVLPSAAVPSCLIYYARLELYLTWHVFYRNKV
jgi:hypothetical protein